MSHSILDWTCNEPLDVLHHDKTKIRIPRFRWDERVILVGKTDSGKTYYARHYLSDVKRLVVLDPKGHISPTNWRLTAAEEGFRDLEAGKAARIRVTDLLGDEEWSEQLWRIYSIGNVLVYIDELYGVGPARGSRGLQAIYTRGRELGIGIWASTQRPALIPRYAISEAEWKVLFEIKIHDDKKRMAQDGGMGQYAYYDLHNHQYMIFRNTMKYPVLWNKLVVKHLPVSSNGGTENGTGLR